MRVLFCSFFAQTQSINDALEQQIYQRDFANDKDMTHAQRFHKKLVLLLGEELIDENLMNENLHLERQQDYRQQTQSAFQSI